MASERPTQSGRGTARPPHEDWIDLARAVCALGVCLLHVFVGFPADGLGAQVGAGRLALWGVVRLALGRFAVPCFLMITGYLVLDPARDMGPRKVGRHLLRLVGLVLTFGWAFAVVECAYDAGRLSLGVVGEGLARALTGRSWDHLWYIYVLIGLYALMPLWRRLAALPRRALGLVTVAWFVGCVVLYGALAAGLEMPSVVITALPAPLYLLLGGCVRRYVPRARPWVWPVGVASLVAAAVILARATLAAGAVVPFVEDYGCPLMTLWSLAAFEWLRSFDVARLRRRGGRLWGAVRVLSRDSLGIYILHPVVTNALYKGLRVTPVGMPVGYVALVWLAEVALSLVATEALRRLPLFRRLL